MTSTRSDGLSHSRLSWAPLLTLVACAALTACGGGGNDETDTAVAMSAEATTSTDMEAAKKTKVLYGLTDLGLDGSFRSDVNNRSAVIVSAGSDPKVYRNGVVQSLPTGCIQLAAALNDAGAVVGTGSYRPVMYSRNTCNDLGTLGGSYGDANDINQHGQVTGGARLPGDAITHAFLYTGGVMRDLGTLPGGQQSSGSALNDLGEVAGQSTTANYQQRAFLYRPGRGMKDLGDLGGGNSIANAINDKTQVVGSSSLRCVAPSCQSPKVHAFLYSNGTLRDIDTLNSTYSSAGGINNDGLVVGTVSIGSGAYSGINGFLYQDGRMQLLTGLLDGSGTSWTILQASSINDDGQISGYAIRAGEVGPFGDPIVHAVLLSPSRKSK